MNEELKERIVWIVKQIDDTESLQHILNLTSLFYQSQLGNHLTTN